MKDKIRNDRRILLALFLALEIILFIALDFAGAGPVLKVFAIILAALLAPFFWQEMRLDLGRGLYILLMPLFLYGIVTMFAPAYLATTLGSTRTETYMGFSLFERIVNGVSIVAIMLIGYYLRKSAVFAAKYVYVLVLAAIALPVAISLFATLINYGFFHTLLYKGYVNFFNGQAYPIENQASFLAGFKMMTVNIDVLTDHALFISSAGLALLFFKKDHARFEFFTLLAISVLGLLTLILTGSFSSLLFLIPALIFVLLVYFNVLKKIKTKTFVYIGLGVLGVGFLAFVMIAFNVFNISALLSGNSFLRRLFYNGRMTKFYEIFAYSILNNNLLGQFRNQSVWFNDPSRTSLLVFPSGSFIFDVLWLDGLLGFIALITFLSLFVTRIVKHYKESEEALGFKVLLISVLLTVFFRYVLFYPFKHYTYKEFAVVDNFPLITSPLFLVSVFFAGYLFETKNEVEEVVHEEN